jgi:hypothetical protein
MYRHRVFLLMATYFFGNDKQADDTMKICSIILPLLSSRWEIFMPLETPDKGSNG